MSTPTPSVDGVGTQRFRDAVAVVTGSSVGIGRAIALRLAAEGARVVINARTAERAAATADELRGEDRIVEPIAADVADPTQAEQLAQRVGDLFGHIDIWVNNAGINIIAPSLDIAAEDFQRVISVDLNGAFFGSRAAARFMVPQGRGVIIQIGSVYGEVGMRERAAYCAAKHGLVGLTKALSSEWSPSGVRVLCVQPGYTRTPMDVDARGKGAYTDEDIKRRTPMGRFATADEVAGVVAFAASSEAAFMSGSTLTLDGGWIAYGGW